jgi:hypothetical protein
MKGWYRLGWLVGVFKIACPVKKKKKKQRQRETEVE